MTSVSISTQAHFLPGCEREFFIAETNYAQT